MQPYLMFLAIACAVVGLGCGQLGFDETDAGATPLETGVDAPILDANTDALVSADAGQDSALIDAGPIDRGDAGPLDASGDAGPMDASRDVGGRDAGNDAGPMDAGSDAGPPPAYVDCDVSRTCLAGFQCEGFVASIGLGKCVPIPVPAGNGNPCSGIDECGDGLLCLGLGRGFGVCQPAWMRGSFEETMNVSIPDDGMELIRTLTAYGLATVDVDVELEVVFVHRSPSEIQIFLTNPDGTEVTVYDGPVALDPMGRVVVQGPLGGFSGDERVNGEWTLRIVDLVAGGGAGILERWSITISSRLD